MRRLLSGFLVLGCAMLAVAADDKPKAVTGPDSFEALKSEYTAANKKATEERTANLKAFREAKTDEEKKEAQKKLQTKIDPVGPGFAGRFLAFAEKNPKDPAAVDALAMAMRLSGGPAQKDGVWKKVVDRLEADYVTTPEIKKVLRNLAYANDPAGEKLVRDVMAKNPDAKVQGRACKALIEKCENAVQAAERVKTNEAYRASVEKRNGAGYVEKLLADGVKAQKEVDDLNKILRDKYAGLFPDLSIGKTVPEVVIPDINGKEAKLSALRGKVVVLDIWATWCPPCRAMIPHEREMVDHLKGKPFALVSISADEEKKTLTDFLEKEKMPWTHWWNGQEGGILEDWEVKYFPTIYVLDANGVIRHKDIRGEKLEEAVNELIKEAEEKKGK